MHTQRSDVRIGISGWTYAGWRGVFFPNGLPHHRELEFASRQVNSIEINGTFYGLQRPSSFQSWYEQTPDDFVFAVKGSRYITHIRRLREARIPLTNFFASGILTLRHKLGPLLWQLPPNFKYDRALLTEFFDLLPRNIAEASALARKHDAWLAPSRTQTRSESKAPLRHALEIRHPSFCQPEAIELLRAHDIALVIADSAGRYPSVEDITSDFLYVRLHGEKELYVSGYNDASLDGWARKLKVWASGGEPPDAQRLGPPTTRTRPRDVYVYFDNDVKVMAPFDAMALLHRLSDFEPAIPMTRKPRLADLRGHPTLGPRAASRRGQWVFKPRYDARKKAA